MPALLNMFTKIIESIHNLLTSIFSGISRRLIFTNDIFQEGIPRYTNGIMFFSMICGSLYPAWNFIYFVKKCSKDTENVAMRSFNRYFTFTMIALLLSQDYICIKTLFSYQHPLGFIYYNISSLIMNWISQGLFYVSTIIFLVFSHIEDPQSIIDHRNEIIGFITLVVCSLLWTIQLALLTIMFPNTKLLGLFHIMGYILKAFCLLRGYWVHFRIEPSIKTMALPSANILTNSHRLIDYDSFIH